MTLSPVFFISHGAPTFALEPGRLGPQLTALGEQLANVSAVVVISPHWQTAEVSVMATPKPATIHDFGGFPPALYELQYPAPGTAPFAAMTVQLLAKAGFKVEVDDQRGLDHGAWVPLRHLLPAANVPVFQVSMPRSLDAAGALCLGQTLAPLRQQSVLIIGSGSMTHNLYEIRPPGSPEETYAGEFAAWIREAVVSNAADRLVNYRSLAPHAMRAHPTEEHFLPLLVALGATTEAETAKIIDSEITYGVLSMESYVWGMAA